MPVPPLIDIVDSTWLAAGPDVVGPIVADPANWPRWWPQLRLRVDESRGPKGMRWFADAIEADHAMAGTAEVWLEPMYEGVVAHFFLRLDPGPAQPVPRRTRERIVQAVRTHTKQAFWTLADELDPGRFERHSR